MTGRFCVINFLLSEIILEIASNSGVVKQNFRVCVDSGNSALKSAVKR
jgi:hypothetical protein